MTLRVMVLGVVEAEVDGTPVALPRPKERAVLSVLAVHAGHTVSVERLVDTLWDDDPPPTAVRTLRSHISRLRKTIGEDHIVTSGRGYKLEMGDTFVDARRFCHLIEKAQRSPPQLARRDLVEALALWRGQPFGDLPQSRRAQAEATRLDELRLSAELNLIDLRLDGGEHSALVGELEVLVSAHPTKEPIWARLALALQRSGRRAEALRVFQNLRRILADQTGLEPGPEILILERQFLADSSALDLPLAGIATPPTEDPSFVGRSDLLQRLDEMWHDTRAGTGRIVVVLGDPGSGKTALMAEFASRVSSAGAIVAYGVSDHDLRVPFLAASDVVRDLAEQVGADPDLVGTTVGPLARRIAEAPMYDPTTAADPKDSTAEFDQPRLLGEADELLRTLSANRPVLIVVDDVQWIDRASAALVRRWSRSTDRRVMIALCYRHQGVDDPGRELMEDLTIRGAPFTLTIEGLSSAEVSELLSDRPDLDPVDLVERTGGNPYLVHQLADHGDPASLPDGVTALVRARLRLVPPRTREALVVAALAGGVIDARVISGVLGAAVDDVVTWLDPAVNSGILDEDPQNLGQYLFDHDLTAEAVSSDVSINRQALLHRQIAGALEQIVSDSNDPLIFAVADHLDSGMAEANKRAGASLAAGRLATRSLAFDDAADWLESALELSESATDLPASVRSAILLEAGRIRGLRRRPGARQLLLSAAESDDSSILIEAALQLTRFNHARFTAEADRKVIDTIKRAIDACPDQNSPEWALLTAGLAAELIWVTGIDTRLALADAALKVARDRADQILLGQVILRVQLSASSPDNLHQRIADTSSVIDALDTTDTPGSYEALVAAQVAQANALFEEGSVDDAASVIDKARDLTTGASHTALSWRITSLETAIATFRGQYSRSEELLAQLAEETAGTGGSKDMLLARGWSQVFIDRGDHQVLEGVVSQVSRDTPSVPGWSSALAVVLCELDRHDEAAPLLADILSSPGFRDHNLGWLTHRCADAFVARELGDRDAMLLLRSLLEPYAGRLCLDIIASVGPVDLSLGMLDAALGDHKKALDHFESAVDLCRRNRAPAWEARCRIELALSRTATGR